MTSITKKNTKPLPLAKNVTVQRSEQISIRNLLIFLNNTLDCDLRNMEDLKTGAVYCQVIHRLFPTAIQIHKVKFYTNSKVDFETNFRLLHISFEKLKVSRFLPVDELILGHNHLDFCNWIYKFFKLNDNGQEYDAKKARKDSQIGLCRSLEIASFSTGNLNAMHKCQSMIFNYAKDLPRYDRRSSLDRSSYQYFRYKKPEPKEEKPLPKSLNTVVPRTSSKTSDFLSESKNVSLPSDSEEELVKQIRQSYKQNRSEDKIRLERKAMAGVSFTIEATNSPEDIKQKPKPSEFTSWKELSERCAQNRRDQLVMIENINVLKCKLCSLNSEKMRLTEKLENVAQSLIKSPDNPAHAVQLIKDILFENPPVVAVRPRQQQESGEPKEANPSPNPNPTIPAMPPRNSKNSKTCIEFTPKESKNRDSDDSTEGPSECQRRRCSCKSRDTRYRREHSSVSRERNRHHHHSRRHRRHSEDSMDENKYHRRHSRSCKARDSKHRHHCTESNYRHRCHSKDSDSSRKHRRYRRSSADRDSENRHKHYSKNCKHISRQRVRHSKSRREPDSESNDSESSSSTKAEVKVHNDQSKQKP